MNDISFNQEKTAEVIAYIASRVDIGKTKLMKLLYLIDFTSYERTGKSITGDQYANWNLGPVPEKTFRGLEGILSGKVSVEISLRGIYPYAKYSVTSAVDTRAFNDDEKNIIDEILTQYGTKQQGELVDMVHKELPWMLTKTGEEIPYFLARYRNYAPLTETELRVISSNAEYIEKIDQAYATYASELQPA